MVRYKHRYIVVQINVTSSEKDQPLEDVTSHQLHNSIVNKVEQLHGDFGVAAIRAGFTTKYCNIHTRIAIIKVRHGPHVLVTSSIPFINTINKMNAVMNTLYIGATIRQCFKFVIKYQQRKVDEHFISASSKISSCEMDLKTKELMDVQSMLNIF